VYRLFDNLQEQGVTWNGKEVGKDTEVRIEIVGGKALVTLLPEFLNETKRGGSLRIIDFYR
jgi:hypothetical protein